MVLISWGNEMPLISGKVKLMKSVSEFAENKNTS
jgi:hypothetical protein